MPYKILIKVYLAVALTCMSITVLVLSFFIYFLSKDQCASHVANIDIEKLKLFIAILFMVSILCVVAFSLFLMNYGINKYIQLAQSGMGDISVLRFPIRVNLLHVVFLVPLSGFCVLSLTPPLVAIFVVTNNLSKCNLV